MDKEPKQIWLQQDGYKLQRQDEQDQSRLSSCLQSGWLWWLMLPLSMLGLAACQQEGPAIPTTIVPAPTLTEMPPLAISEEVVPQTVPATYTAQPEQELVSVTPANLPSFTPIPSNTPWPTFTPTGTATGTPTNTPISTPITPLTPTSNVSAPIAQATNLLPNPSFEEGWYHIDGIPELQVPNRWTLEWHQGHNALDPDPWNRYVRPESRVLNGDFLPEDEHDLFIWDGAYTTKIFKREGALSFRLTTQVRLHPGTYLFEINVFPDMIEGYSEMGGKIWASDPLSAELRFYLDTPGGDWMLPIFGQKNTFHHAFQVTETRIVRLGVAFRGRWAIKNNGWFMDDWSLTQLS